MKKRILSIILAITMLACMIPTSTVTAFAETGEIPKATVWIAESGATATFNVDNGAQVAEGFEIQLIDLEALGGYEGPQVSINSDPFDIGETYTVTESDIEDGINIVVTAKAVDNRIDVSTNGNGKAYADPEEYQISGEDLTVTLTAEPAEGYVFSGWILNTVAHGTATIEEPKSATATMTIPAGTYGDIHVMAVFKVLHTHTFADTWTSDENGHWHACTADDCDVPEEEISSHTSDGFAYSTHTEETVSGRPATCTEAGLTEGVACSECGEVLTAQTVIEPTGHSYSSEVTTQPTCTEKGVRTYTCSGCGDTYTEVIPANGHSIVNGICSICGYVDIPAYRAVKIAEIKGVANIPAENKGTKAYYDLISYYETQINGVETKEEIDSLTADAIKCLNDFMPEIHKVTVGGGSATIVSKGLNPMMSTKYEFATVEIAEDDGVDENGKWFVYWTDKDGTILSTYSTYRFFVVKDIELIPVYVSPDEYDAERAKGVLVNNIVRAETNNNRTVTIFTEHSASKAAVGNAIGQHGIIYTTDLDSVPDLKIGSNNKLVNVIFAQTTNTALTGILRTTVNPKNADKIYAVAFITDAKGNTTYSEMKEIEVAKLSTNSVALGTLEATLDQTEEVLPSEAPAEEEPADYTALNNAIAEADALNKDYYTTDSYAAVAEALAAAKAVPTDLPVDNQAQIDAATEALNNAMVNLELLPANYTDLAAAINANKAKYNKSADYTAESFAPFKAAYDAAVAAYDAQEITIDRQGEVDALKDALVNVAAALAYAPYNYTAINNAIAAFEALDKDDYTPESYEAVEAAIAAVPQGLTKAPADVAKGGKALAAINNAVKALVLAGPADYSAVNAAIAAAAALNSEDYTAESWAAVGNAIGAVTTGLNSNHQGEVDAMAKAINDAIGALEEKPVAPADYTALNAAITAANKIKETSKKSATENIKNYTPDTWAAFAKAKSAAEAIPADLKTDQQKEIDDATAALTAAQAALVWAPFDYTDTYKLLDDISALNELDYTPASWSNLQAKKNALVFDYTMQNFSKGMSQYTALNTSKKHLVLAGAADYSAVNAAIAATEALDSEDYTAESWAAVDAAVKNVTEGLNSNHQGEVDAMAKAINDAIAALVKKFDPAEHKAAKIAEIKSVANIPDKNKETQAYKDLIEFYETKINNAETQEEMDSLAAEAIKYLNDFIPETHTVTVNNGATATQTFDPEQSTKYEIATVSIKEDDGIREDGKWFVYWTDGDGNIVSTYSTYSFFVVKDIELTPVYVSPDSYDSERAKGVLVNNIVRTDINDNGTVTLFTEHSASQAAVGNAIGQHGIIYTTDSGSTSDLIIGSDNEHVKVISAKKTNTSLTGLFRTTVNPENADKIYAVTFITDANGNTTYGEMKEIEVAILSTNSFTLGSLETTLVQAEEVLPEEAPAEEKPAAPSFTDFVMSIINAVIALLNAIIGLF